MTIDFLLKWKQFAYISRQVDRSDWIGDGASSEDHTSTAGSRQWPLCPGEEGLAAVRLGRSCSGHFGTIFGPCKTLSAQHVHHISRGDRYITFFSFLKLLDIYRFSSANVGRRLRPRDLIFTPCANLMPVLHVIVSTATTYVYPRGRTALQLANVGIENRCREGMVIDGSPSTRSNNSIFLSHLTSLFALTYQPFSAYEPVDSVLSIDTYVPVEPPFLFLGDILIF